MIFRSLLVSFSCLLFVTSSAFAQGQETLPGRTSPAPTLRTAKEQMSYAMGLNLGANVGSAGVDLDPALVARGLVDALQRVQPAMTDEQIGAALEMFGKAAEAKAKERFAALGEQNKKEGPGFLAENKRQQGVVVTPSGLQVQVLKQGTGPQPQKTDTVQVHYTGRFINGQIFDTTAEMKEPLELGVTQVIPGWTEALLRMKVGDKWKLVIPSELAYGANGSPPTIPPNAVLVFEIELVGIAPRR